MTSWDMKFADIAEKNYIPSKYNGHHQCEIEDLDNYSFYHTYFNHVWANLRRNQTVLHVCKDKRVKITWMKITLITADIVSYENLWNAVTVLCGQLDCDDDTS